MAPGMYDFFPRASTPNEQHAQDFVVEQLKKRFLLLAGQECYPKTPDTTSELDFIINTIRELEKENIENSSQE